MMAILFLVTDLLLWSRMGVLLITVADILALSSFESVELVEACEGAGSREVRNVGILDCPPDYNEYSVYVPREFILTNLGFAWDNPVLAERSLLAMIRRGVAAIAIKTVYKPPISDCVRKESIALGVPLYLYEGAYHEKVSYESLSLIRREQEGLDKGKILDALLAPHDGEHVRRSLNSIFDVTGSTTQCFALGLPVGDKCLFYATIDTMSSALSSIKDDHGIIESASVSPYHDRILVLLSYGNADSEQQSSIEAHCLVLLGALGNLCCGVGEIVRLADGDISIHQAIAAVEAAEQRGKRLVRWSELYASAFADAARSSRLFVSASNLYRSMLASYDSKHGAELIDTAEMLVHACGDVKAVAEALCQHPNTIRYRVRKMKTILGIPDESDKKLLYLLDLIFLPMLEIPQ